VLREAVRVGAADLDAGRFRTFRSAADLTTHLHAISEEAIGDAAG